MCHYSVQLHAVSLVLHATVASHALVALVSFDFNVRVVTLRRQ